MATKPMLRPRALAHARSGWLALTALGALVVLAGLFAFNAIDTRVSMSAARAGGARLATALVRNDPSAAPPGGADYVGGIRRYFGPVSRAHVYRVYHRVPSGYGMEQDTNTFALADLLLDTRRGEVALEVRFDTGARRKRVEFVYELDPAHAPGLSDGQRKQLEIAFAKRGGKAVQDLALATAAPADIVPTTSSPPKARATRSAPSKLHAPAVDRALRTATTSMDCVRRAHGDVVKLSACTQAAASAPPS